MKGCLEFLQAVYRVFGFTFKLNLSTRPDKFIGEAATWDKAEKVSVIPRMLLQCPVFLKFQNCFVFYSCLEISSHIS